MFPVDRIFIMNHPQLLISDIRYCGLESTAVLTSYISEIKISSLSIHVFFNDYDLNNRIGFISHISFYFDYI
jgi:hypothetical protein